MSPTWLVKYVEVTHGHECHEEEHHGEDAAGAERPGADHRAFPNSPVGRTARITASSTKVSRAERLEYAAGR